MHKIKIEFADRISELESRVNAIIKDLDVIDIKYQATQWGQHDARYTALIIYRVEETPYE